MYPDKWTKWAENEVNDTGEDCAVMGGTITNKTWKSVNCNETHQVVCQITSKFNTNLYIVTFNSKKKNEL